MLDFTDLILVFHLARCFLFIMTSVLEELLLWIECLERDIRIEAIFRSCAIIEDKRLANRRHLFVVIKATKFVLKMVI